MYITMSMTCPACGEELDANEKVKVDEIQLEKKDEVVKIKMLEEIPGFSFTCNACQKTFGVTGLDVYLDNGSIIEY